jgi:ribonuclease R
MLSLMRAHGLDERFPAASESAAREQSPTLSASDLDGRRDFREWLTLTIDPEDAKDFDDAVSLELCPGGDMILGVHIADVAHYVARDSEVDREAYVRATSVYLVDRVITMLPPYLTTEVCSLRAGEDRLTHSVLMHLTAQGDVREVETAASVIHSRARLSYEQAQGVLDGHDEDGLAPDVREAVTRMHALARELRARRLRDGSVDLVMPEVKCEVDQDGRVLAIHKRAATEAYQLIEEFMLLANQAVARKMAAAGDPGIYRVHDEPNEQQWGQMTIDLDAVGIHAAPRTAADINKVARRVRGTGTEFIAQLAMLKNFKRAEYAAECRGHFGLAFTHYTHFTSPIRRYPDLIAHRVLQAIERGQPPPYSPAALASMARHCSVREREADEAEKESVEIKRLDYFRRRLWSGDIGPHTGCIVGMTPKGLFVELEDSLQRGLVPFHSFPDDFYRINRERTEARGRRSRSVWSIGQRVEVELARVDATRRFVDFRMVTPPRRANPHVPRPLRGDAPKGPK